MENKEIKLILDVNKINIILSGLGELPAKLSLDVISEIHKQVSEQLNNTPAEN